MYNNVLKISGIGTNESEKCNDYCEDKIVGKLERQSGVSEKQNQSPIK